MGSKTKEEFFKEMNIDPDELNYLGKGEFGEAYSTNDGRVVKTTSSKSEFDIAKQLENNKSKAFDSFAKIYKAEIVQGRYYIIMEELEEDSEIEELYYELENYLNEQDLPIQYIEYLDFENIEINEKLEKFISDIKDINSAYRHLGVEASDIRPENLGYSKDGKVKAFDVDDKAAKRH